jgi:hypothetical protein
VLEWLFVQGIIGRAAGNRILCSCVCELTLQQQQQQQQQQ